MTVDVYDNCYTCWNGSPTDAGDKGLGSVCGVADADRARLAGHLADIDIVTACGESDTGINAQRDVVAAAGVVLERLPTDGRVQTTVDVTEERLVTLGGIIFAHRVGRKRARAGGSVAAACNVV